jgi:hypothetical protein
LVTGYVVEVNADALRERPVNADIQQAEYFLVVLGQERAEVAARLAHHRSELVRYEHGGDLAGSRRKKRLIRALEKEVFDIEQMLAALSKLVGVSASGDWD